MAVFVGRAAAAALPPSQQQQWLLEVLDASKVRSGRAPEGWSLPLRLRLQQRLVALEGQEGPFCSLWGQRAESCYARGAAGGTSRPCEAAGAWRQERGGRALLGLLALPAK